MQTAMTNVSMVIIMFTEDNQDMYHTPTSNEMSTDNAVCMFVLRHA